MELVPNNSTDVGDIVIMVTCSWRQKIGDIIDKNGQIYHQHLKLVTNTFFSQIYVTNIDVARDLWSENLV